jgi:hypothetical protein
VLDSLCPTGTRKLARNMNIQPCQLEMRFEQATPCSRRPQRRRRTTRARWWFEQMRLAVEQAREYNPAGIGSWELPAGTSQGQALDSRL